MKTKKVGKKAMTKATPVRSGEESFAEIAGLIAEARERAVQAVNTALIDLYWQVGEAISRKIQVDGWGKGTVGELALYIQRQQPGIRGFSAQNLWRMRQFFEAYRVEPKLSPLVRELPWTHHMIILGQSKRPEEQEFYLRTAIQERWSSRELESQFRRGAFERAVSATGSECHLDPGRTTQCLIARQVLPGR